MTLAINRRAFLQASAATGGVFALEFTFPATALAQAKAAAAPAEVTAWVLIHPNDSVVIRIARSEMGQGSLTGLAQLVAEELECDWSKVSTEFVSPNEHVKRKRIWGSMSTGGSAGIRTSQEYVRKAGASAREMLVSAAATQWKVPASECTVDKGVITHTASKRRVSYGKVAADAAKLEPPDQKTVKLKDPKDWKIAGKSMRRLELPDKVLGKPIFGVDVQLPGMLHASIVQSPVFLGKVKSIDSAAAEKMRGVKGVVKGDGWVAVVADNWWRANNAAKALKIEWDEGANGKVSDETIKALFKAGLDEKNLPEAKKVGDVGPALAAAAKVVEAEYYSPYLSHATMEPMTSTAWFKDDGMLHVWTSTQNGEASMAAASEAGGLPLEKVEVYKTMLGGGFGRRGAPQDYVRQSVVIAKQFMGKPVKLIWSREEDMQHGFYRPASLVRMKAGLDAQGNVTAFQSTIACPSILALLRPEGIQKGIDFTAVRTLSDMSYTIPNQLCEYAQKNPHVPVGFWRAPGLQNAYYRECFVDELAHAAGKDPLAFRLAMMKPDDKNRLVLEAVAKAANYGAPLPPGVFRGIAQSDGFGSFTAMVAEVSVNPKGEIKVHRVVLAIDSGYVVNPDACHAQAQGNVIFCIGQFYQGHTIKDGRVMESNFHDFQLPRLPEMPKVETVFASTGGFWGGHGEPGALCVAPAILNAAFAATGKRIRSLPFKPEELVKA
ncbi:xanthine dehydrogenase family protein molybdopterin-binding subunit [Usitatibacter palustris]|uniref:Membrane-bound aldehyde dehydrogenase [pyrroloquinoline-quinone] n=1 Tax=Usitatibacter palustris TaxID=2732487 RepID=A0A6M4HA27_9PROT|nr:molybdopterin cofactor-binding domain-containing protein [Usitatibacter palustris]QJR16025.1 Membrane-bound aldehyde dehydrogenase [pyrroloquinoline-quinone] [Usitatibacter palustris]